MDRKVSRISRSAMLVVLALAGTGVALPSLADDGVIVLTREVQPRIATRPALIPDPNPSTVNANVSPIVHRALDSYELSDKDFAGVASGSGIQRLILPDGHLPGLGVSNADAAQGLPGMNGGSTGGAGSGIANQVNRSLQQGLAPLKILTGGR